MEACLSEMGMDVDYQAQITEILHGVNQEALEWRSNWYDQADAHIITEDKLAEAKKEIQALNGVCTTYEARERQYERELQEAASEKTAIEIERNNERCEYGRELASCKEHAEDLSKEDQRLQAMLEQIMEENHKEHFQGWYTTAKKNNDQLAAINAEQEEKIQKLEHDLLLRRKIYPLGKRAPILYESNIEVWKRRAERAEGVCAKMSPNPLIDERETGLTAAMVGGWELWRENLGRCLHT